MTRTRQTASVVPLADAYKKIMRRPPRPSGMSPADSEDIVHDACVRLLDVLPDNEVSNPSGYLKRIAHNLTIDRYRSRARLSHICANEEEEWRDSGETVLDPERIISDRQQLDIVLSAIEKLPPRCAEALKLHRFLGLSYPDIARKMGISISMVEKHISEALVRLARALAESDALPRRAQRRSNRVAIGIGCIIAVTLGLTYCLSSPFWTTLDWTTR